jgi:hypothetical protein
MSSKVHKIQRTTRLPHEVALVHDRSVALKPDFSKSSAFLWKWIVKSSPPLVFVFTGEFAIPCTDATRERAINPVTKITPSASTDSRRRRILFTSRPISLSLICPFRLSIKMKSPRSDLGFGRTCGL